MTNEVNISKSEPLIMVHHLKKLIIIKISAYTLLVQTYIKEYHIDMIYIKLI